MIKLINNAFAPIVVIAAIVTGFALSTPTNAQAQDIVDGDLISARGDMDVYIVKKINNKNFKRLILNPTIFESYNHFDWVDIKHVEQSVLEEYETSTLVRYHDENGDIADERVFMLFPDGDSGIKRHLDITPEEFGENFDKDSIYRMNYLEAGDRFYRTEDSLTNEDLEEIIGYEAGEGVGGEKRTSTVLGQRASSGTTSPTPNSRGNTQSTNTPNSIPSNTLTPTKTAHNPTPSPQSGQPTTTQSSDTGTSETSSVKNPLFYIRADVLGHDSIKISWPRHPANNLKYAVFWNKDNARSSEEEDTGYTVTGKSYTIENLEPCTVYISKVYGKRDNERPTHFSIETMVKTRHDSAVSDNCPEEQGSNPVRAVDVNLQARMIGTSGVRLTWDSIEGEISVLWQRADGEEDQHGYHRRMSEPFTGTSYTRSDLDSGATYKFQLWIDRDNEFLMSETIRGITGSK